MPEVDGANALDIVDEEEEIRKLEEAEAEAKGDSFVKDDDEQC